MLDKDTGEVLRYVYWIFFSLIAFWFLKKIFDVSAFFTGIIIPVIVGCLYVGDLLLFAIPKYKLKNKVATAINLEMIREYQRRFNMPEPFWITWTKELGHTYLWITDNILYICKSVNHFKNINDLPQDLAPYKIPVSNILYFKVIGDIYSQTIITGGGSSLGGAITGGVIAGAPGAIIGGRKEIKTENKRIDNRQIILVYKENENTDTLTFSYGSLEMFHKLIPQKDIDYARQHPTKGEDVWI